MVEFARWLSGWASHRPPPVDNPNAGGTAPPGLSPTIPRWLLERPFADGRARRALLSKNGHLLLWEIEDRRLRLIHLDTGTEARRIDSFQAEDGSLAVPIAFRCSSDGGVLAVACAPPDGAKGWDLHLVIDGSRSGDHVPVVSSYRVPPEDVERRARVRPAFDVSPDGRRIASADCRDAVEILDVGPNSVTRLGCVDPVAVAFSPCGDMLLCGSRVCRLWRVGPDPEEIRTFSAPSFLEDVGFDAGGEAVLLAGSEQGYFIGLRAALISTGEEMPLRPVLPEAVLLEHYRGSPDFRAATFLFGRSVVFGASDGWWGEVLKDEAGFRIVAPRGCRADFAIFGNETLAMSTRNGALRVWDTRTAAPLATVPLS